MGDDGLVEVPLIFHEEEDLPFMRRNASEDHLEAVKKSKKRKAENGVSIESNGSKKMKQKMSCMTNNKENAHYNLGEHSKAPNHQLGSPLKRVTVKQKRVQLKQLVLCESDEMRNGTKVNKNHRKKLSLSMITGKSDPAEEAYSDLTENELAESSHRLPKITLDGCFGKELKIADAETAWREVNLSRINSMELIGRSCKIYWPLDDKWYDGAVREFNPISKKHRVDYADHESEWIILSRERVQFQMSVEEEKSLYTSKISTVKPNPDEMALLAHNMELCEEGIGSGTVVWAKVKGWPMWPALVVSKEQAFKCGLGTVSGRDTLAVQFFGSCDFARLNRKMVVIFAKGLLLKFHEKCRKPAFEQGLKEVDRYLKEGKVPHKMLQSLELQLMSKSHETLKDYQTSDALPENFKPVNILFKHPERCSVCYVDEEYVDNLFLQCDKCRLTVHMSCYGEMKMPNGGLWLCRICEPDGPQTSPVCCLCPVEGGAMKKTTDDRWAHLACALWIPETCVTDVRRMEEIDGVSSIHKERWKLECSICKVAYGACIQCNHQLCRTAYHPLCARGDGLCMEVQESTGTAGTSERHLELVSYCRRHKKTESTSQNTNSINNNININTQLPHSAGCARCEAYNPLSRRGRQEPEAMSSALAKRSFVQSTSSCRRLWRLEKNGSVYKSLPITCPSSSPSPSSSSSSSSCASPSSSSARIQQMRSTVRQRITFGKSNIHGWGVFSIQPHQIGDMIVEYVGEIVRVSVADLREKRHYNRIVGAGTYMFRMNEDRVVDSTCVGNIAHLLNHSCEPNCYSRLIAANGQDHVIIFAKSAIAVGQELTYDYRIISKDEKLSCYCGAKCCRGTANV